MAIRSMLFLSVLTVVGGILAQVTVKPVPHPSGMHGGSPQRNMVNLTDKGFAHEFPTDPDDPQKHVVGNRLLWKAALGSRCGATPVVANGKIFIGTNNDSPRNKRDRRKPNDDNPDGDPLDKSILMCFDAHNGQFLWQMVHDKLSDRPVCDFLRIGIASTPTVEDDRVYYVSNRGEVMCLDANGFRNGNQGFAQEKYRDDTDGDVLWKFDMIKELGVEPHFQSTCSPLLVGDLLFVVTGNGVDETHTTVNNPNAPSFLCLSKHTGKVLWHSNLPGKNVMHGQWSSAAYGMFGGQAQVIFPGGDGWLYAFVPETGKLLWKFDANLKDAKHQFDGRGTKNEFHGMPVVYQEKVFIGTGQDPEHFEGVAHFWCINPVGKTGDISAEIVLEGATKPNPQSGVVWRYGGAENRPHVERAFVFGRTLGTACIVDDVVYIGELGGFVHCLDARTGKPYWCHDVKAALWSSCYYVAGKIVVANEDGDLIFIKHDKEPEVIDVFGNASAAAVAAEQEAKAKGLPTNVVRQAYRKAAKEGRKKLADKYVLQQVELSGAIRSTSIVVADVMYVATENTLYALRAK